jgi:myo-inositol-1(or 4)-monophosphatase
MAEAAGPDLARTLRIAEEIATEAGRILMPGWGTRPDVGFKSENVNLITEYDRRSEAAIVGKLAAAFPDDSVVAEEGASRQGASGRVWYVDPLDGTTNFVHGLPLFAVSIGLWSGGRSLAGVVDAPALGWHFAGCAGGEARWNGRPIHPSPVARLDRALLVTGFPYVRDPATSNMPEFAAMTDASQGVRRLGSAALDLCFIASGWLDGYWEARLKPWDLVAGAAIAEAAGGRVTALDGGPFQPETGAILASNGHIHDQMIARLREVREVAEK